MSKAVPSKTSENNSISVHQSEQSVGASEWRVTYVLERLKENPALSIRALAKVLGLSTSGLRHLVERQNLGLNLRSFRTRCQLNLACELLGQTDLPLKEIRVRCGIPDGANFNRIFKSIFHTTPGKFRTTAFTNKKPNLLMY